MNLFWAGRVILRRKRFLQPKRLGAGPENGWVAGVKRFILERLERVGAIVGELKQGALRLAIEGGAALFSAN